MASTTQGSPSPRPSPAASGAGAGGKTSPMFGPDAAGALGAARPGLDPRYFTGRTLLAYPKGKMPKGVAALGRRTALKPGRIASLADFQQPEIDVASVLAQADALRVEELDLLIVNDPAMLQGLNPATVEGGEMPALGLERISYIDGPAPRPTFDDLKGILDALDAFLRKFHPESGGLDQPASADPIAGATSFRDTATTTWGLQATLAASGLYTGRGAKVAILDTGIDPNHPDFLDRAGGLFMQSFVNESIDDLRGHGTHVAGTACGKRSGPMIYGVAPDAALYVAKVFLGLTAGVTDTVVATAIAWAIRNGCHVANLSFSSPVPPGLPYNAAFERVAKNALQSGLLLVSAAGNNSQGGQGGRLDPPAPVGHPANCPSVLAVGALDPDLGVAAYSNGGQGAAGNGQVNFAAPGTDVVSSWPTTLPSPKPGYNVDSGTSMASPHVAGLAALMAGSLGGVGGLPLWQALTLGPVRALPGLQPRDVGFGLPQAAQ